MKTLYFIFTFVLLSTLLNSIIINVPVDQSYIQDAITVAVNGDTVLVQPGYYWDNVGFNGKLITVASLYLTTADTSYISSTIIDGDTGGPTVYFISGEDSTAVLCGFTITNGIESGIYCVNSSPNLEHLKITDNEAINGGGISCSSNSNPIIKNVTIAGNTAQYGGGISCMDNSNPTIYNTIISNNLASGDGGGMYSENYSDPYLEDVTISDNIASNGGGIYCYMSSPTILYGQIIRNTTSGDGGGIRGNSAFNLNLTNTTVADNYAWDNGGGIYSYAGSTVMNNVTISGNSADDGGGIYALFAEIQVYNSILWNDTPNELYIDSGGAYTTFQYSNIEGFTGGGVSLIDIDPLFLDPGNNNYNLYYTSPCIDTGNPVSPLDPDGTRADMGAFFFDQSINIEPTIASVNDVPNDQGRSIQLVWDKSPYDIPPASAVELASYSVWRFDDIFDVRGKYEIYDDPLIILDRASGNSTKKYYWQRDNEILTFITQLPVMGYDQYSIISPTLQDSSIVSSNHSTFQVVAHTYYAYTYFTSLPDSGYSVDNIAPDGTNIVITNNGSSMNLIWNEVEYGTFQGNSYPEVNGIWYKIYAGDSPDFICDEAHLVDTVTNLYYSYPIGSDEKKFFKVVVSDQP